MVIIPVGAINAVSLNIYWYPVSYSKWLRNFTAEYFCLMDGWVRVLRPFNSISVISRQWKDEYEKLYAMKRRLGSERISPPVGFQPATPWSEVGSANCSAMRTLRYFCLKNNLHYRWILTAIKLLLACVVQNTFSCNREFWLHAHTITGRK